MIETSVTLIVFNRPDFVEKQVEVLRKVQPRKLFVISDAARVDRPGEDEKVARSRELLLHPDWDCEVVTNFAKENMRCDPRIKSGLDWVFSQVDRSIVLEDDCVPDESFFLFCDELLEKYKDDERIGYIAGSNQIRKVHVKESYTFAFHGWTLGWATWSRAWNGQEDLLAAYRKEGNAFWERREFPKYEREDLEKNLKKYAKGNGFPWDFNFAGNVCKKGQLSIVPCENLVVHVGFRGDATHATQPFYGYDATTYSLEFPLVHPKMVEENKKYELEAYRMFRGESLWRKMLTVDFYRRQLRKVRKKLGELA